MHMPPGSAPGAPQALPSDWQAWLDDTLLALEARQVLRKLHALVPTRHAAQVVATPQALQEWLGVGAEEALRLSGRPLRLFSTNDYLGLSTHEAVCEAAAHAARLAGSGPRSSPLVGGHTEQHAALERELAALKGKEAALLFSSGFGANLAALSTLCGPGAAIFSDELNHASIVDGARLAARAGAALHVYRHSDLGHLEALLRGCPAATRRLIVSDALFSMDGDYARLEGLLALRRRYGAVLVLDEAHTSLVGWGPLGDQYDEEEGPDIVVGTLSKALGAHGGFIACSARMRSLLLSRGRPVIFSTALPLPVVEAARAALQAARQEPWRKRHLWALVGRLGRGLGVPAPSPIVPLIFGDEGRALQASRALLLRGFYVPAIRPPTVPKGTSRLRISLSAAHTEGDVDALVAAIQECCELKVPLGAGGPLGDGLPQAEAGASAALAPAVASKL